MDASPTPAGAPAAAAQPHRIAPEAFAERARAIEAGTSVTAQNARPIVG